MSLTLGWSFLPTTLVLKGNVPAFDSAWSLLNALGLRALVAIRGAHIDLLLLAAAFVLMTRRRTSGPLSTSEIILALFLTGSALHLQLASMNGRLYRYEVYLVALALTGLGLALYERRRSQKTPLGMAQRAGVAALVMIFLSSFGPRAWNVSQGTPSASRNVYDQHLQIARFLQNFYPDARVAANDIGAITYYTDIRLIDLWGLAHREIMELKRAGKFDLPAVERITRDAEIAILYPAWFEGLIPPGWIEVARWRLKRNVAASSDTVSFYALRPEDVPRLWAALAAMAPELPEGVDFAWVSLPGQPTGPVRVSAPPGP